MDILRAKEIIEGLANGVNPLTGEVLAPEDSCNQPDVIRALHAILSALPEKMQKSQRRMRVNHGQVKMTAFLRPCMMKEKHAKKYANTSNVQQAASLRDWSDWEKQPTEEPLEKNINQALPFAGSRGSPETYEAENMQPNRTINNKITVYLSSAWLARLNAMQRKKFLSMKHMTAGNLQATELLMQTTPGFKHFDSGVGGILPERRSCRKGCRIGAEVLKSSKSNPRSC